MSGINKVIVIGNLGKDPETRYMQNGNAVTSFSVATSEKWRDKTSGETKEQTEWHNIVAFGSLGEIAGKWLVKGSKAYVEGKLKTDKYEKNGQQHYSTKIVARDIQFLSGTQDRAANTQDRQASSAAPMGDDDFDDDIPF